MKKPMDHVRMLELEILASASSSQATKESEELRLGLLEAMEEIQRLEEELLAAKAKRR